MSEEHHPECCGEPMTTDGHLLRCEVCLRQEEVKPAEPDLSSPPESLEHYSADEVAECVSGISKETYAELWNALGEAEAAGTAKPLGGDGSDGTIEEPVITSGEYGSDLVAIWPRLSEAARRNIHQAAEAAERRTH